MSKSSKPKIVIVEGSQGAGKTTLTNILRDKMPYTNLMRLSGIKDKSKEARVKVVNIYHNLQQLLQGTSGTDMNWLFDRTFITERMYCKLGYKDYTFEEDYNYFLMGLDRLTEHYDVYVFVLVAKEEDYVERLNRDKPQYAGVVFNAEGSMRQQEAYLDLMLDIKRKYPNIEAMPISTSGRDPVDIAYDIVEGINMR